ncbi:MAG TPA: sugar-binding protein, partial [Kofleriaceae bacterium]|nr:sugar-binding protein [Kofleriaceae bacterium]
MTSRYTLPLCFAISTAILDPACDSGRTNDSAEDDVATQLTAGTLYTAPRLRTTPSIDGQLGEYTTLPAIALSGASGSADVRAAWDAQALYLAFDVTDETLLPASGTESALWNGDGIEVMIDAANDRSATADLNDYHFIVSSSGQLADSRAWSDYTYASGATVQTTPRSGGYRVEMTIPFAALGVTPSSGLQLGFDVAFNDRDVAGGELTSTDYAGLGAFNDPAGWGTLVLSPPTHTAPRFAVAPSNDGALDEYATVPAITLAGASGSAEVRIGWDAQALYLGFDVTDGTLLPASGTESALWNGDGIEVMIDAADDRSATSDLNDYHFIVSSSGQLADSRGWSDYTYASGATVQAVPRTGGYRVELTIPFAALDVTASAGLQLGFDVAFNDRDVAGGALTSTDFAGLTAFNSPTGWGALVLGSMTIAGCGDAVCNNGEDCSSCAEDCGECASGGSTHTAPHFDGTPSIDGQLGEYTTLPAIALSGASGSADVRAAWNAQALYLAFDVTDGTLLPASGTESALWNGDGIEVMIDAANDRSATADLNDYHFIVSSSGQLADSRGWSDYTYASGATVQAVPRTGGYRVEMTIPFAALGVTPSSGLQLGFDVAFNDRDVAGGALTSTDFAGLTAFNSPTGWGALV